MLGLRGRFLAHNSLMPLRNLSHVCATETLVSLFDLINWYKKSGLIEIVRHHFSDNKHLILFVVVLQSH